MGHPSCSRLVRYEVQGSVLGPRLVGGLLVW
ncbi:MAG: hypothetical protein QOJ51_3681, partial [Acidobacteriaceae bacterium]|nr:hypothetical protein [Acidobacteriaceae bacterium]